MAVYIPYDAEFCKVKDIFYKELKLKYWSWDREIAAWYFYSSRTTLCRIATQFFKYYNIKPAHPNAITNPYYKKKNWSEKWAEIMKRKHYRIRSPWRNENAINTILFNKPTADTDSKMNDNSSDNESNNSTDGTNNNNNAPYHFRRTQARKQRENTNNKSSRAPMTTQSSKKPKTSQQNNKQVSFNANKVKKARMRTKATNNNNNNNNNLINNSNNNERLPLIDSDNESQLTTMTLQTIPPAYSVRSSDVDYEGSNGNYSVSDSNNSNDSDGLASSNDELPNNDSVYTVEDANADARLAESQNRKRRNKTDEAALGGPPARKKMRLNNNNAIATDTTVRQRLQKPRQQQQVSQPKKTRPTRKRKPQAKAPQPPQSAVNVNDASFQNRSNAALASILQSPPPGM